MKRITTKLKLDMVLMTLVLSALTMNTLSCTKKAETQAARRSEVLENQSQFVRLWTDTKNDSYLRLDLNTKGVDYMGVHFYDKRHQCEKALWMTVGQIQQLQAKKVSDDKQPTRNRSPKRAGGKNTKKSK